MVESSLSIFFFVDDKVEIQREFKYSQSQKGRQ